MQPYSRKLTQAVLFSGSVQTNNKCSLDLLAHQNHFSKQSGKSCPPQANSTSLLSSLSSPENKKVNALLPPSAFLFDLSGHLNPMVEKESIQWMRLSVSKNPFYLILINKITHPLKLIKK